MTIHLLQNDAEYKTALEAVSAYFGDEPQPGTEDAARFEVLLTLIQIYERKHFPLGLPDPLA